MRRRSRRPETYTLIQCQHCINVYDDMPCGGAFTDMIPLMLMSTPRNIVADPTQVSNPSDKFVVVDGIKFQKEYFHDPLESQSFAACDPGALQISMLLRIWEAIILLPLAQGTTNVPAYVPDLTAPAFQSGDLADRVLWKRLSSLPIWGTQVTLIPQLEHTLRDEGHGPVVVKTRCRVDDRHGLFYATTYTHNVFGLVGNPTNCTVDEVTNPCVIPVRDDAWFKIFYHTRK